MSQVFVVDRAAFFGGTWPEGFVPMAGSAASAFLDRALAAGRFVDRPEAERTPAWKQWIPYCVIRARAAAAQEDGLRPTDLRAPLVGIFHVQRTTGQGETRLHGARSIGLGGHVEPVDHEGPRPPSGAGFFGNALVRELDEELANDGPAWTPRFVGLLNDDRTPVGTVHAGLVHVHDVVLPLDAAKARVRIREISKMQGGFGSLVEFQELWQDSAKFESWSRLLIHAGVAGHLAPPVGIEDSGQGDSANGR